MCEYINKHRVPSEPLLDQLVDQRWLRFPNHGHECHMIKGSHHYENDVMDKTHPLAQHNDRSVLLLLLSSYQIHIPLIIRLCNSRISEKCLVCYQTSQRNWVIIKMLHRYLRKVFVGLPQIEIRICHSEYQRGISGPSR